MMRGAGTVKANQDTIALAARFRATRPVLRFHRMPDTPSPARDTTPPVAAGTEVGRYRPLERFWPYRDLAEQPSEEELASLDPDLREALFGAQGRPFSITLVFPRFEGPGYERALTLARASAEYREVGEGPAFRSRARFLPSDAERLRDLFEVVGPLDQTEVLVDERPLPFARELWLPLIWYLIPR
jgi:hypothetical protein